MALVKVNQSALIASPIEETYLTADIASGSSTITVANISGFGLDKVLVINPFSEKSEIVLTSATIEPSGTTITLKATTTTGQAHYSGEKVYLISYNQVEISTATTATGSKTVLTTTNFQPDKTELVYDDTANSLGFYFARFYNTITAAFSDYTDALAVTGWGRNTVGFMIQRALRDSSLIFSEKLTIQDCYEWLNSGMQFIQGKLKRWPEHYSYNAVLGQASRGNNVITMPTDAYDTETNKSIIALRVGTGKNLTYLDPVLFDNQLGEVAVTQVRTAGSVAATSLAVDNSYDFADSGSVNIYISGTKYTVTYTGVTRSATAGVLTGIPASGTGSISVTIPVDTYVWQNEEEGLPLWFTVRNGNIEYYPLVDGSKDNANIYGDYSKVATVINSDGDTIDYQRYDMLQDYLTWKIRMKMNNDGILDMTDGYYLSFKEKLNDAIRTLAQNNRFPMRPAVNKMFKRMPLRKANLQDLSIDQQ